MRGRYLQVSAPHPSLVPGIKPDENAICPGQSWPEYPKNTLGTDVLRIIRHDGAKNRAGRRVSCAGGGPSGSRALAKKSPPTWRKSPPISPPPAKFSPGGKIPPHHGSARGGMEGDSLQSATKCLGIAL